MEATKAKPAAGTGTGFPDIKREAGERLWFGAVADAPFHYHTFGGATFHKETFSYVRDKSGEIVDDDRSGFPKAKYHVAAVEVFTPERLKRVREDIENSVVAKVRLPDREDGRGHVVETDRFRARVFKRTDSNVPANVEPVSKYLFMLPEKERKNHESGDDVPTLT